MNAIGPGYILTSLVEELGENGCLREALVPSTLLGSLLVVDAGVIGLEFASFYNTFGTIVTVVEIMGQILPSADKESIMFRKTWKNRGSGSFLGLNQDIRYLARASYACQSSKKVRSKK